MPRKSAKGTESICKAPHPDGGKCNNIFIRNQHKASDHKFCSTRCRNRYSRQQKKKKEAEIKKLNKRRYKNLEDITSKGYRLKEVTQKLNNIMDQIINLWTPIIIPEPKGITHFKTVEEYEKYTANLKRVKAMELRRQKGAEDLPRLDNEAKRLYNILANTIKEDGKLGKEDNTVFRKVMGELTPKLLYIGIIIKKGFY